MTNEGIRTALVDEHEPTARLSTQRAAEKRAWVTPYRHDYRMLKGGSAGQLHSQDEHQRSHRFCRRLTLGRRKGNRWLSQLAMHDLTPLHRQPAGWSYHRRSVVRLELGFHVPGNRHGLTELSSIRRDLHLSTPLQKAQRSIEDVVAVALKITTSPCLWMSKYSNGDTYLSHRMRE